MPKVNRKTLSRDAFLGVVIALAGIGGVVFSLDWISRSLLVLFAIGLTIFAARRHSAHPLWRATGALVIIGLFVGLSWRPIWNDFLEKHPDILKSSAAVRSAANGPYLELKVAATFLCQTLIDNKPTAGLVIIASITNTGSVQTIAKNFKVAVAKDGNIYQGIVIGSPKIVSVSPYLPQDKTGPMYLVEEDVLYTKTATPLAPGSQVYGFLLVTFPNISGYKAIAGGAQIKTTFEDAFSNQYFDIAIPSGTDTDMRSVIMRVYPGMHTKLPDK